MQVICNLLDNAARFTLEEISFMVNFSIRRLIPEKNLYMEVQFWTALQHPGLWGLQKDGCNTI
jgi:signal transduction histidine kinase